ncbi:tetratricopeptide repeat protein [Dinoroseobacter sp. S124A]|uniref:tetratricopeptide repeat protein n=1 Tax=Dinoroseobacter sp. S124A TaxID=3415128 RepID=UPI003C7E4618
MRWILLVGLCLTPAAGLAAGGDDFAPPVKSETTTSCSGSTVWDEKTRSCVSSSQSSLGDDQRHEAVRELAYAGAYDRALQVLASYDNPQDPRALTYQGFVARKTGDLDGAMTYYAAALAQDPDYHPARSYRAQGYLEIGQRAEAEAELREIKARGGRETWAAFSLAQALRSNSGYAY